jgi:hypothetical protein
LEEPPDAALESRELVLQPCVRLLVLHAPVQAWLSATSNPPAVQGLPATRELHLVWRSREDCLRASREPLHLLPLLRELRKGGTLEVLLRRCARLPGAATLRAAFLRWRVDGLLALAPAATH